MWPGLVQTAKEGGVDVIETYGFWNGHELSPGNVSNLEAIHRPCFDKLLPMHSWEKK